MRYLRLGRTDLEVSAIALGCGNFGGIGSVPELIGQGEDERAAFALMDAAREHGITLFDTANSYGWGRSEATVGRWLASRRARDEIVLTTKVRNRVGPGPGDEGLSARHIREQIEASLRRLGTDHVDLYLAHEPDPSVPIDETMAAFDGLIRTGKVRHAGLSNYDAGQVRAAVEAAGAAGLAAPANLQNGYSLLDRRAAGTFGVCAEHGIAFTAYSPLAGGWLTGKYRAGRSYPAGSRMTLRPHPYRELEQPATFAALEELDRAAADRGASLPALALAWVLTDPGVAAAIVGPRRPQQLAPAAEALEIRLDPDEREALTAIAAGATAGGAPA
ncbi:MAG TPA: aldo/keto reductase [Actinomycetes bacterium]|jgi:aryl-alcohol dehydrogenase-like predicted oxidoreductase|nr:aldo/keto reductase [Actinomycetes bacterium]